ncbi:rhomboid family intramembrane serine protease [Halomicroarcula sp. F13]|uniref:Rhomboid family intramembrane serine protease n=1 Tax=Haloarcula rubra TaxID=2487747 RepID=A0AAW4PMX0_9EURY|nr:rhomboid family intramembrane serine protease [Halomicroarcula rubra]MBX0321682.1 rhomboid family intramembrane serine protease [Halomicroarcula rubra]
MSECDVCGKQENMPYQCGHCGGTYCAEHRLPESHDCAGLDNWDDPQGVFDSGFDDSVDTGGSSSSGGVASRLGLDTGPGGPMAYFRGNMTYVFLAAMAITFIAEQVVLGIAGRDLFQTLFVLHPDNPEYVWTWVTSVFAHSPRGFYHILGNGIIIYFFGRIVEQQMGSKRFTVFFLVSGMLAGLGQIALQVVQGTGAYGVLGASGAALAILAFLTVLNPSLRVYLYFLIPVPIWAITGFYVLFSILGSLSPGSVGLLGGNIAHTAHLIGLAIGLWYGRKFKSEMRVPSQLQFGRGGGGPGGPGGPGGRGPF